jgi:hypothetical protein
MSKNAIMPESVHKFCMEPYEAILRRSGKNGNAKKKSVNYGIPYGVLVVIPVEMKYNFVIIIKN